jgi:hypothetical protein
MRMGVQEILNIKDWLTDGLTTEALANRTTLSYTLEKLCEEYVALHGNDPRNVLEVCGVLDLLYKKVWESKMDKGFPNFNRPRG